MKTTASIGALVAAFTAAAVLAAPAARAVALGAPNQAEGTDPLFRMVGGFKEALGDAAFMKADIYLHGGTDVLVLQKFGEKHEEGGHEDHDHDGHDHDRRRHEGGPSDDSRYHEAADPAVLAEPPSWVWKIYRQVKISEHRHTSGEENRELLPLLEAAVKLNPHHVPAILNTAYWIDENFGKTDDAIRLLEQGLRDNPGNWELAETLGRLHFEQKKDYAGAVTWFEKGVNYARHAPDAVLESKVRGMFLYLGKSYIELNNPERAIQALTVALQLAEKAKAPLSQIRAELRKARSMLAPADLIEL